LRNSRNSVTRLLLISDIRAFLSVSYIDTEGSLPCTQHLTPVPILSHARPMHKFPPYFQSIHSNIVPIYIQVFLVISSLKVFQPEFLCISRICHACYMTRLSHPLPFHRPNNVWLSVQVMKFLIVQSSPVSYHLRPLRSKCSPQHPVLKHSQCMFLPYRDTPRYTRITTALHVSVFIFTVCSSCNVYTLRTGSVWFRTKEQRTDS